MASPSIPNPYAEAHASPSGPGDARPTAYQMIKDNDLLGKMTDKTFLVTGGTDGLGLETVRTLAKTGARVFFTARSGEKAKKIVDLLAVEGKTDGDLKNARIEWVQIDNMSLKSVKAGAEDFLRRSDKLNVLVANAGALPNFRAGCPKMASRHSSRPLAHFYLFQLLRPLLLKSSTRSFNSRVVTVASTAHAFSTVQLGNYGQESKVKSGYDKLCELDVDFNPIIAYGQSKTANIWMANEIERRYGAEGLHGLSIHPGGIVTAGYANMDPIVQPIFEPLFSTEAFQKVFKSLPQGAATQVLAAVGKDYEGKGGFYMEDCGVSRPIPDDEMVGTYGYRSWAFNPDGEKRLWADSLKMAGLDADE
ncbi:hypothetical protein LTR91_023349 [Friedmanniomyces endolithicus]|uniref:WW domain-containing oxidoreductase n=1 Tax=Friedmanniomyces endolithicus TaxID=329885 RepID=A0AAN6H953_9PEZI|nr:hypothetical protein LTS09_005660 [Friedmanniomyces endolithicus]KAK0344341.1 hypothetical protein LTR94_014868 [Friedmanniomyces endolithicus]KAK0783732.1 hypothetical protein LTR38_012912 [Friedmanniomyces endolithicus]KAK0797777.1 hypothetical protein LTR59_006686 [Friedmanniomyces endolithicus]KAK0845374.1 hypothetical protein LTS02_015321 [Friedmanniomyces endolithicus]